MHRIPSSGWRRCQSCCKPVRVLYQTLGGDTGVKRSIKLRGEEALPWCLRGSSARRMQIWEKNDRRGLRERCRAASRLRRRWGQVGNKREREGERARWGEDEGRIWRRLLKQQVWGTGKGVGWVHRSRRSHRGSRWMEASEENAIWRCQPMANPISGLGLLCNYVTKEIPPPPSPFLYLNKFTPCHHSLGNHSFVKL